MISNDSSTKSLIGRVLTKEQQDSAIESVEEADRWLYKGGQALLSEKIAGAVPSGFARFVREAEESGQLPSSHPPAGRAGSGQKEFLADLKRQLEGLPQAKLTLAFEPGEEFIRKLSNWFQKQTGKHIILDISIKESITGGCVLEYEGEYRDYSLQSRLEKVLEDEFKMTNSK